MEFKDVVRIFSSFSAGRECARREPRQAGFEANLCKVIYLMKGARQCWRER